MRSLGEVVVELLQDFSLLRCGLVAAEHFLNCFEGVDDTVRVSSLPDAPCMDEPFSFGDIHGYPLMVLCCRTGDAESRDHVKLDGKHGVCMINPWM